MHHDRIADLLRKMQEMADELERIQSEVRTALDAIGAHHESIDSEVRSILDVHRKAHPRSRRRG